MNILQKFKSVQLHCNAIIYYDITKIFYFIHFAVFLSILIIMMMFYIININKSLFCELTVNTKKNIFFFF